MREVHTGRRYLVTVKQLLEFAEESSGESGLVVLYVSVGLDDGQPPVVSYFPVMERGDVVHTANEAGQTLIVESSILPS